MKYLIDLSGIIDLENFHEYISKKLNFPTYYGQNFDAFWDCLTNMEENSIIRVEGIADFRKNLPRAYDKLNKCIIHYRDKYDQIEFILLDGSPSQKD